MVFRGKPSKACERCRLRRLRVGLESPNPALALSSLEARSNLACSAISTVALVGNASEQMRFAQDIGIRNSSGFEMKARL